MRIWLVWVVVVCAAAVADAQQCRRQCKKGERRDGSGCCIPDPSAVKPSPSPAVRPAPSPSPSPAVRPAPSPSPRKIVRPSSPSPKVPAGPPAAVKVTRPAFVPRVVAPPPLPKPAAVPEPVAQPLEVGGAVREEQIKMLESMVDATADSDPEKPDFLFRLAEAYAASFRAKRGTTEGKKALLAAVKTFQKLTEFKQYPRLDRALVSYAYMLGQGGYGKEQLSMLRQLIKDYPASAYVADAYVEFGNYYLDSGDLTAASEFYQRALKFPKSAVAPFARYRFGLVLFNQGDHAKAMKELLDARAGTKDPALRRAITHVLVRSYVEAGDVVKAAPFFEQNSDDVLAALDVLASLYLESGKSDRAIYLYRELLKRSPRDKRVCGWLRGSLEAVSTTGAKPLFDELIVALGAAGPLGCVDVGAEARQLSAVWQGEAAKTLNPATLEMVRRIYWKWFEAFPDARKDPEVQRAYAEMLWARAQLIKTRAEAADAWKDVMSEFDRLAANGGAPEAVRAAARDAVAGAKDNLLAN